MDGDIYQQFSVRPNVHRAPIAIQSPYFPSVNPLYQQWHLAGSNISQTGNRHMCYPHIGSSFNNQFQIQSALSGHGQWTVVQDTGARPASQIDHRQASMNVQPRGISALYNPSLPDYMSSSYYQPTTSGLDGLARSSLLHAGGGGMIPDTSPNGAVVDFNYYALPYGSASSGMPFNMQPVVSQTAAPKLGQMQSQVNSVAYVSTAMSTVPEITTSVGQAFIMQSVPVNVPDQCATLFTEPPGTINGMPRASPNTVRGVPRVNAGQLVSLDRNPNYEPSRFISQGNGLVTIAVPSTSVNCGDRSSRSLGLASSQVLSSVIRMRPPVCVTTPRAQNYSAVSLAERSPLLNALLESKKSSTNTVSNTKPSNTISNSIRSRKRKLSSSSGSSSDSLSNSQTTKRDTCVSRQCVYELRSRGNSTLPGYGTDAMFDNEEVAELDKDDDDDNDLTWRVESRNNMTTPEDKESDMVSDNSPVDNRRLLYTKAAASIKKKTTNYEDICETGDSLAFVMECYDDSGDFPDVRTRKTSRPVQDVSTSNFPAQLKNRENNTESEVSTLSRLSNFVELVGGAGRSVSKNNIESRNGYVAKKPSAGGIARTDDVVLVEAPTSELTFLEKINISKSARDCSSAVKAKSITIDVCKEKRMPNNSVLMKASLSSSANKCTGVHLQLLCFRLDDNSLTLNRLIGWQESESSMVSNAIEGKTHKFFQCVFCPFVDTSRGRIAAHVNVRHTEVIFALTAHTLSDRPLMFLFCRHCNFVGYDNVMMLLHFHTYHSLSLIVCDSAFCPNTVAAEAGRLDPNARAVVCSYYCCTSCSFMSAQKVYATDHVATEHASKFANCFVPLVMILQPNASCSESYLKHANDERFANRRKNIFACVRCPYISFNSYEALSHNLQNHRKLFMVFICDVINPSCNKRFSSGLDAQQHVKLVHAKELSGHNGMLKLSVTLMNMVGTVPVECYFSPGECPPSEVGVRRQISIELSGSTLIEIDDDDENVSASKVIEIVDENDDDDDVLIIDDVPTNLSDKTQPLSRVTDAVDARVTSNESRVVNSLGVGNEADRFSVEACRELNSLDLEVRNEINISVEKQISTDNSEVCSINVPERNLLAETVSVTCCEIVGSTGSSIGMIESSAPSDRGIELPSTCLETNCVNGSVSFERIDGAETNCSNEYDESNSTVGSYMIPGSDHDEAITSNYSSINVNLVKNTNLSCVVDAHNDCETNVCSSIPEASQTSGVVKDNSLDSGESQNITYSKQRVVVTDILPTVQNCTSCTDMARHCVWANGDYLDNAETLRSSSECGSTVSDCGEITVSLRYVMNTGGLVSNPHLTNDISISTCDEQQYVNHSYSSQSSTVEEVSLNSTLNHRSKFKRLASYRFIPIKDAVELTTADSNQGDRNISSFMTQSCIISAEELSQLNELP